jgi:hypothetical protein
MDFSFGGARSRLQAGLIAGKARAGVSDSPD